MLLRAALGVALGVGLWHLTPTWPSPAAIPLAIAAGVLLLLLSAWFSRRSPSPAVPLRPSYLLPSLLSLSAIALLAWGMAAERSRIALPLSPPASFSAVLEATLTVIDRAPLIGPPRAVVVRFDPSEEPSTSWIRSARLSLPTDLSYPLLPGDRYRATVRLKPVYAPANPGSFDREWWWFRQGIDARGALLSATPLTPATELGLRWKRFRSQLAERLERAAPQHGEWLRALALGDRSGFDESLWSLVQTTGTAHLVAISGMHVALIAWLIGGIAYHLWRQSVLLTNTIPAPYVRWSTIIPSAWLYVALAGFGIPAVRAAIMITVVAFAQLLSRRFPTYAPLALAFLIVLLWDPWAIGEAGFWLSFTAVAVLLLLDQTEGRSHPFSPPSRATPPSRLGPLLAALRPFASLLRLQFLLTLSLFPLTAFFFGQTPLLGTLANLFAIPLVAWIATPLALLLLAFPSLLLGNLFDRLISLLIPLLEAFAALPGAAIALPDLPLPVLLLTAVLLLSALFPLSPPRLLALPALLLPILAQPDRPKEGAARITLLDVGQGQAIHIQTARHDLLYDVGPAHRSWNAGAHIVVPYLRAKGVRRLDTIILSHLDADHAGGAEAIIDRYTVDQILFGGTLPPDPPSPLTHRRAARCRAGEQWIWDQVRFTILWPHDRLFTSRDNDRSCVLLVESAGGHRFLVAGDLSTHAEAALLATTDLSPVTATVINHHGSSTSSSFAWIASLSPRWALLSVALDSPYRHPRCDVLSRWQKAGAEIARTDGEGALTLTLPENEEASPQLRSYRRDHQRYWRSLPHTTCHP
ncbi:MAG: DNA internalization-related competence protein ComEC/Rec2 [Hydrogenophilus sp.]|nr:DNA internalization-related competence protein ComEC/Rec2 [Hydrogenophilus sp.]